MDEHDVLCRDISPRQRRPGEHACLGTPESEGKGQVWERPQDRENMGHSPQVVEAHLSFFLDSFLGLPGCVWREADSC